MRILFGVLILIVSTAVGYTLSLKFSKKRQFFESFNSFNKKFISEVGFSQRSLVDLIGQLSKDDDFYKSITGCVQNKERVENIKYLTEDENDLLKNYLDNLGVGDKNTQLVFLKGISEQIEKGLGDSIQNEKKYKNLYVKVGFLIGLIGLIMFL